MLAALVRYTEQHELEEGSAWSTEVGAMHLIGKEVLIKLNLPLKICLPMFFSISVPADLSRDEIVLSRHWNPPQ